MKCEMHTRFWSANTQGRSLKNSVIFCIGP